MTCCPDPNGSISTPACGRHGDQGQMMLLAWKPSCPLLCDQFLLLSVLPRVVHLGLLAVREISLSQRKCLTLNKKGNK